MTRTGTGKYEQLLERCRSLEPVATAVAHPCEETALSGAVEAAKRGLIAPMLVGPEGQDPRDCEGARHRPRVIPDRRRSSQPCGRGEGGGARSPGRAQNSDEGQPALRTRLLGAVVARETGLRTGRRLSHVFIMDVPTYHKVLIVTDAAINIAPTLEDKADICQNAIDLAISLGVERPKVAILAAVETVNSKMPATIDAAALCKMADRGQITGGILDGPLAFDNAISRRGREIKGITSEVAGDPDILLVPDLEAGNMLAKQLIFLANADSAGLVLGARVPIILTSRADSVRSRIASCAVAVLAAHARRQEPRERVSRPMNDYALVLNAGSSSLKFCVFRSAGGRGLAPRGTRPDRRHRHRAAACRRRTARAKLSTTSSSTPRSTMRATRAGRARRVAPLALWRRARSRRRTSRRPRRREVRRAHSSSRRRSLSRPAHADPARPACISRTISLPIEAVAERFRTCRRSRASTPAFIAASRRSPSVVPLPSEIRRAGVQRYGFHGLSYEYIASALPQVAPEIAGGRVIVAHLGSGASLCALKDGKSIDSTLRLHGARRALHGHPARARSIPGVVLYLFQNLGLSAKDVEAILYKKSGLLGISGISNDMRDLLGKQPIQPRAWPSTTSSTEPRRKSARWRRCSAGSTRLVFTAGIGERSAEIRRRICEASAWLGIDLDAGRQRAPRPANFPQGQPRLGLGDPDERRADDRAAHRANARNGRARI